MPVGIVIVPPRIDQGSGRVAQDSGGDDDADMVETHNRSSPEAPISPSGITRPDEMVIALRIRSACRPFPISRALSASGEADDLLVRDRALRELCCRLLGWSAARAGQIDDVMDILLVAVARGTPIALRGGSDLVPVAYALHRKLLGADRPFVVCDPRRREGEGSVRCPPNRRTGLLALDAAMDGSLCLHSRRLPADFDLLTPRLRGGLPTTTFVCLHDDDRVRDLLCRPIEIPSLAERAPELDRLLDESLDDAAETLGLPRARLSRRVRRIVLDHVASFADLEKTALRVVALVSAPNVTQAALRLRMAPVSLIRWLRRRSWVAAASMTAQRAIAAPRIELLEEPGGRDDAHDTHATGTHDRHEPI